MPKIRKPKIALLVISLLLFNHSFVVRRNLTRHNSIVYFFKSAEAMLTCGRQMVECAPLPTRDYARAEESLWLATGAFHGDHGLRDPRFCPIFCSFARMVMQLSGDFAMA